MINDLTRYFMLTVSYKFNTFGKGNMPTDRNMGGWASPAIWRPWRTSAAFLKRTGTKRCRG